MTLLELFEKTLSAPYLELEEEAASYCAERDGETLRLFFEKSNGATDWRNNLDFPAKPYGEMKNLWFVHRGFLRVFRALEPRLRAAIGDLSVKKIVLSGYSHGAALALLSHEYCVYNRPDIASSVRGFGFGCPRVVWGRLPRRVAARFRNFTVVRNCRDLVTRLPPVLLGYRHAGSVLHVGREEREGAVDSHRPESYLRALSREVERELDD